MRLPRSTFARFALMLGLLLILSQGVAYLLFHHYVLDPAAARFAQLLSNNNQLYLSRALQSPPLPPAFQTQPAAASPGHAPQATFLRMTAAHLRQREPGAQLRVSASDAAGNAWLWIRNGSHARWLGIQTGSLNLAGSPFILLRLLLIEALTLLGVLVVVRQINHPLKQLAERARRIGRGDSPAQEPSVGGPIEVLALEQAMQRMADDLRELYGERSLLLTGISHELRTPLSRLLLALHLSDQQLAAQRAEMQTDVEEMNEIIDRFLALVRSGREEAWVDGNACEFMHHMAELGRLRSGLNIELDCPETQARLRYKPMSMERVFRNLFDNAARYGGGRLVMSLHAQPAHLEIRLRDFGPGVPDALLQQLGHHSPQLQAGRNGAGIGLKICRRMIAMQGGDISFQNAADGGLDIRINLLAKAPGASPATQTGKPSKR
jgi:two-component system osmolarity sensor histidine kinase EnvZ